MKTEEKRIAIVPGSFDPITVGHLNLVTRAAQLYDRVYLAVMINRDKRYMFTLGQRKILAEAAVRDMERVTVVSSEGMLWELARDLGACAIVKGYRNETDRTYELQMAEYNRARYPLAETVLLRSDDSLSCVSSTVVRTKILEGEDLSPYLPQAVIDEIYKIVPRRI